VEQWLAQYAHRLGATNSLPPSWGRFKFEISLRSTSFSESDWLLPAKKTTTETATTANRTHLLRLLGPSDTVRGYDATVVGSSSAAVDLCLHSLLAPVGELGSSF
jgi:hypothetical protein